MDDVDRVAEAIRKEIGTRHQGLPKGGWEGLMKKAARAAIAAMGAENAKLRAEVESLKLQVEAWMLADPDRYAA